MTRLSTFLEAARDGAIACRFVAAANVAALAHSRPDDVREQSIP
jgi:hypothetical protein